MQTTLSARLTYRIMAVVLVMMAVIAGVVYYTVSSYMRDETKEIYLGLLLKNHQDVHRQLLKVSVALENNVHDIERDLARPETMLPHLERIVRENPPIVCCNLLFEPYYYPSEGRLFLPMARQDAADGNKVIATKVDSTYHSYFSDVWVPEQLKKDDSSWTKPYYESATFASGQEPRLLASYAVPIHNAEGRAVAMLAADLSLEELRTRIMENIKEINEQYEEGLTHQSYFFIVDRKGIYVMHPDRKRILTPFDDAVGKKMLAHRGTCKTEVDGVTSRLYYRSIPGTDWTMVIVTPQDVIMANAVRLNSLILLTMLVGLAVIYLICRRQIKGIADPVATQKATIEHELKIANAIQMAMLPHPLSSQHSSLTSGIDLYASLTPAREVGGDLYDYFIRAGQLFFCIGDVSGKGIPAALVMALVKAMFRSESSRADSAVDIVNAINRNFCEENNAGYFITMFVGILDLTTGRLDYCNAGHEPPLLCAQAAGLNCKRNLPIGTLPDWNYEGQQTQMQAGDMLFLYTDGLNEAQNEAGQQLGRNRIRQLAAEHVCDTAQHLIILMETEVNRHANGAQQSDDITMLAIRWQPKAELTMKATMADMARLEPFIQQTALQAGLSEREAKRLRLATEEAIANIINHGQAAAITLQAAIEEQKLVLTIIDDGLPFDPTRESATDLSIPADQRPPGGLGIIFIQQMADSLTYQRIDGHNVLKIEKTI